MTTPLKRYPRLATLKGIRLELGSVYREMKDGSLAAQDGTRRAYVLKMMADVIALADLEKRLAAIEERQEQDRLMPYPRLAAVANA